MATIEAEWVKIDWLKAKTGYKDIATLKKRILLPYRDELETIIYYPKKRGEHWKINRSHMEQWLINHPIV